MTAEDLADSSNFHVYSSNHPKTVSKNTNLAKKVRFAKTTPLPDSEQIYNFSNSTTTPDLHFTKNTPKTPFNARTKKLLSKHTPASPYHLYSTPREDPNLSLTNDDKEENSILYETPQKWDEY
jgi:hypothetical protein